MVNKEQMKKRLKRFEILSGLGYSKEAGEIWLEHYKDLDERKFIKACLEVEKGIKWHILPTLQNIEGALKPKWDSI